MATELSSMDSSIKKFYENSTILITGGTGFIGKLLLEKLLRSCSGIKKIYLVIRKKEDVNDRLKNIFKSALFEPLLEKNRNVINKVYALEGDCKLANFGLKQDALNILKNEVEIVFHNASKANFDASLKECIVTNIGGTRTLISLAKEMKKLKTFIYVSTVYSGYLQLELEEIIHNTGNDIENLLLVGQKSKEALEDIKDKIIKNWPNSVLFTKAVVEEYIQKEASELPVGIVRPSIVLSTFKEPIEGYTELSSAPSKLSLSYLAGVFHSPLVNKSAAVDIVPADYAINAIITCAWGCYNKDIVMKDTKELYQTSMPESIFDDTQKKSELPVFNIVSSTLNVLRWGQFWQYMRMMSDSFPLQSMVWFQYIFTTNCKFLFYTYFYLLHCPFLFVYGMVANAFGLDKRYLQIGDESIKIMEMMRPITEREFMILNHNTQNVFALLSDHDKQEFNFDFSKLDYYAFVKTHAAGVRQYLAEESMDNMADANSKHRRMKIGNFIVGIALSYILARIFMYILNIQAKGLF